MAQTIRITITPDMEKALEILRHSTLGTLNTTELIKMAIGSLARQRSTNLHPNDLDKISLQLFSQWAKEDGTLEFDNISDNAKLRPYTPEPYVPTRKG